MNTLPLDPTILALADQANAWLMMAHFLAGMRSTKAKPFTVPDLLAEGLLIEQATACGYLSTASRGRKVRRAAYCAGAVKPEPKADPMTDGEKFGLHTKAVA